MIDTGKKLKILFLCTKNSCRSQMAEGWAHSLKDGVVDVWSAGTEPGDIDPRAVLVMKEAGIDISGQYSKHVNDVMDIEFDYVVTVCGHAYENCPYFPGKTRIVHVGFNDPPKLAEHAKSVEEALDHYRRVRDEIRLFVERLPDIQLNGNTNA
ncbi:arsenate reductase ArsC [Candidatus Latescibacterota bacterium]